MYRSALLTLATVLLLGPSQSACGERDTLCGLHVGYGRYDTPTSTQGPSIYTPAYAPVYDGIYTPANAPPLTRRYVPAYARSFVSAHVAAPISRAVYPEPTDEGETSKLEIPPAVAVPAEDKPVLKPTEPAISRSLGDTDSSTIILCVPDTATVWINGHKTASQGTHRKYTSVGLQKGLGYRYRIVVEVGAHQTERDVVLTAGETKLVK